jgi:hypothetical protein
MAIDERELRRRLDGELGAVEPQIAPVAAVLRQGRRIKLQRRVRAAGALAVVLAAAVAVPALLHGHGRPAPPVVRHRHPKVTVTRLTGHVPHGVIAAGNAAGRRWQMTFDKKPGRLCVLISHTAPDCSSGPGASDVSGFATLGGPSAADWPSVVGAVRHDVTKVSIELSDGAVVDLHPFAAAGSRWVGIVTPRSVRMVRAIAYAGHRELGYSVAFQGPSSASPSFSTWLRPGQRGPARLTRRIGSGVADGSAWSATGYAGPWGYCVVLAAPGIASSACGSGGNQDLGVGAGQEVPRWLVKSVRRSVAYVELTMSDRSQVRVPAVEFGGARLYAVAIVAHPKIVRWAAYDVAGRKLFGGQGPPRMQ